MTYKTDEIHVVSGSGTGTTELAAFDAALLDCGLGNYNLIRLSSVLPPGMKVIQQKKWTPAAHDWGHKLYVVYAFGSAVKPGAGVCAGIGWVIVDEASGAGLFVEHEAPTKKECQQLITDTLDSMLRNRGLNADELEKHMVFSNAQCESDPVGVLVAAVFASEGW